MMQFPPFKSSAGNMVAVCHLLRTGSCTPGLILNPLNSCREFHFNKLALCLCVCVCVCLCVCVCVCVCYIRPVQPLGNILTVTSSLSQLVVICIIEQSSRGDCMYIWLCDYVYIYMHLYVLRRGGCTIRFSRSWRLKCKTRAFVSFSIILAASTSHTRALSWTVRYWTRWTASPQLGWVHRLIRVARKLFSSR